MFDIPSNPKIEKCIITKETVVNKAEPKLIINEDKKEIKRTSKKQKEMPKRTEETA